MLFELDLTNKPRLDRIRDLFLIGAWTGCRYSDFHQVNPKNIRGQDIEIRQHKGDGTVMVPLHPVVSAILNKHNNDLPRVLTNKCLNKYLKELGQLAGLNEPFHKTMTIGGIRTTKEYLTWELIKAHTARRSFATNLYKSGFPSISIMKITGHKTETEFLKYIKVTPQEHADKLREHWRQKGVYDQPDNNQPVMENEFKTTPSDELISRDLGAPGTAERDNFDTKVKAAAIGWQLKELRQQRNMTQQQLADKVGIDKTQISKIEKGSRNLTIETIARIVHSLGGSFDLNIRTA